MLFVVWCLVLSVCYSLFVVCIVMLIDWFLIVLALRLLLVSCFSLFVACFV